MTSDFQLDKGILKWRTMSWDFCPQMPLISKINFKHWIISHQEEKAPPIHFHNLPAKTCQAAMSNMRRLLVTDSVIEDTSAKYSKQVEWQVTTCRMCQGGEMLAQFRRESVSPPRLAAAAGSGRRLLSSCEREVCSRRQQLTVPRSWEHYQPAYQCHSF